MEMQKETKAKTGVCVDWSIETVHIVQEGEQITCNGYHCGRLLSVGEPFTLHEVKFKNMKGLLFPFCRNCFPFVETEEELNEMDVAREFLLTNPHGKELLQELAPMIEKEG